MRSFSRRNFLWTASSAALATAAAASFASRRASVAPGAPKRKRVYIASLAPEGLLAYHWDPVAAELISAGPAASVAQVAWVEATASGEFLFTASELDSFNGKHTGEVASFRQLHGELTPVSTANSAGIGTCHVALDHTGRVLVAADYRGGSAASFRIKNGALGEAVWQEHYTGHGPNPDRQTAPHEHFVSFSPDNRFVYINDLGLDAIHIYKLNAVTAQLTSAGSFAAAPGSGPRTLHFHPNNRIAYSMNELSSTVDLLEWNRADGSLTLIKRLELLPKGYSGATHGCDTVITRDGRFVYFANRGDNSLYAFKADPRSGELEAIKRTGCGGKTPRHFTLDPTERWMLVANQNSDQISVIARDPLTGELSETAKSFAAKTPMRILFT